MTKDELIQTYINQKIKNSRTTWGEFISALATATADQKADIEQALLDNDLNRTGSIVLEIINAKLIKDITSDVRTKMAGVNVKIDDILSFYNPE